MSYGGGRCGGSIEKVKRSFQKTRGLESRKEVASAQLKPCDHGLLAIAKTCSGIVRTKSVRFSPRTIDRDKGWQVYEKLLSMPSNVCGVVERGNEI